MKSVRDYFSELKEETARLDAAQAIRSAKARRDDVFHWYLSRVCTVIVLVLWMVVVAHIAWSQLK